MTQIVRLSDFVALPGSGVHVPPADAAIPAGYLDGAERFLLEALQDVEDRSVGSPALAPLMVDWASRYHLTPYRSTLFDALGFHAAGDRRVLELGAGCGAITRWLGEHFGEVHAVEGNADRARVARTRCEDLENVQLYAANYSQLEESETYDVATLIGVLEYGHLYHPDTRDPRAAALANLRVARRALRQDGALILAIENKLGLKYLNGAREDHSARPYDSINGYPSAANAVTFSARELEGLLAEAGFDHATFLLPFPDYKLARTLINPALVRDEHEIHGWLQEPAPDRGFPSRQISFNETLAQREVVRAGLLRDLANSFLVVAYRGDVAATDDRLGLRTDWVARHYSLDRRPACRKRVTLEPGASVVRHERALAPAGTGEPTTLLGAFEHHLADEPYAPGEVVLLKVLEVLAAEGVGDGFAQCVHQLRAWVVEEHGTGLERDGVALVAGEALDASWWNVVADRETGAWRQIDREWRFRGMLPVDYIPWRCLRNFAMRFGSYLPQPWAELGYDDFATNVLRLAGEPVDPVRLDVLIQLERAFAVASVPGPLPSLPAAVEQLLADVAPRFQVLASAEEIVAQPSLLRAYADAFGSADASTLVLLSRASAADVVGSLRDAIAAAGLDEDTMPDTLLVDGSDPVGPAAVLTGDAGWAPSGIPRFAEHELPALRALAERHWAAAA